MNITEILGDRIMIENMVRSTISAEYVSWLNDKHLMRYSNQRFLNHTVESCLGYLRSFENSPNSFLAIRYLDIDAIVGTMTIYREPRHQTADVGILVGHELARGIGIGLEAWTLICSYLFETERTRKLTAGTMQLNRAMLRIFERSGMRHEATRHAQELYDGKPVDVMYYAMFESDYRIAQGAN